MAFIKAGGKIVPKKRQKSAPEYRPEAEIVQENENVSVEDPGIAGNSEDISEEEGAKEEIQEEEKE